MMRRSLILVVLVFSASVLYAQRNFTAYDLFRMKEVVQAEVSPNERYVAYTVNINRGFNEPAGTDYRQLRIMDLSSGEHSVFDLEINRVVAISWIPGTEKVSFLANTGDGRGGQVYAIDINNQEIEQVTNAPSSIVQYKWNPDGRSLAYISIEDQLSPAEREERSAYISMGFNAQVFEEELTDRNLYLWNLEKNEQKQLTRNVSIWDMEWNPSGDKILLQVTEDNLVDQSLMFKRLHVLDLKTEELEKLVNNPGKLGGMAWSPDGKHVAFISAVDISDPLDGSIYMIPSDRFSTFEDIRNYSKGFEGTVLNIAWKNNNTLLFSAEESVDVTLSEIRINGKNRKVVIEGGNVVFNNFSVSGNTIAFSGHTADHPSELFTYNLRRNRLNRQTELNTWLKEINMGKQVGISYEARDGLRIDGVLVYPVDFEEGTTYPLINMIHGGPEASIQNGWVTRYNRWGQIAAGKGYFVFYPNYRASSSRGVEFLKMGHKDLAGAEFDDVLDGIEYLVNLGYVDHSRVGIGGGSYGGYFSAWAATRHSEHFAAAVSFVGISNQISKRNTTDIPFEDYHVHWRIHTNEDPELVYDRSPVKWAANQQTPILILHGKEDTRVHPAQSLELYRSLKMHGNAPVRLIWYPGEGHGNRRNPAQLDYALRTMEWFDFYLKGDDRDGKPDKNLRINWEELPESPEF